MTVSVIMPVYNAETNVGKAIESVLSQTVSDFELIIIDDRSNDGSRKIIEYFASCDDRIKTIFNSTNAGVSEARNTGLDFARGELIAFCDADDVWLPHKLEKQIPLAIKYGASHSRYYEIDVKDNIRTVRLFPIKVGYLNLKVRNQIAHSSFLIKREHLNGLRFNSIYHEDYEFLMRVFQKNFNSVSPRMPLLKYRWTSNGLSGSRLKSLVGYVRTHRRQGTPLLLIAFLFLLNLLDRVYWKMVFIAGKKKFMPEN